MPGENIRTIRKEQGLSQEELAERIHVVRQTVSKWEKGVPKLKDTTLKPTLTLLPNNIILEVTFMKRLISCEYNFDNCCVELKFTDGIEIRVHFIFRNWVKCSSRLVQENKR